MLFKFLKKPFVKVPAIPLNLVIIFSYFLAGQIVHIMTCTLLYKIESATVDKRLLFTGFRISQVQSFKTIINEEWSFHRVKFWYQLT